MKLLSITTCALMLTLAACNNAADTKTTGTDTAAPATADTSTAAAATPPPDSATMMKNWQAYMTPGDMHKMMASWSGTWTGDVSMWMKPGEAPMKSTGVATNTMAMNGLYQVSKHKGMMMGMPFEGMGTLAFDNIKKAFVNTWIDNMGSGIMKMEGPWDEATKTLTLTGTMVDPMTGKDCTMKETLKVVDANTQVMEMYGPGPDGKEFKTMEITLKRKK
jgi:hypothetical protein